MALPLANLVKAAIETLFAVAAEDKTVQGSRQFVQTLNELRVFLRNQYRGNIVDIALTSDADDADVAAFIVAEAAAAAGVIFRKGGTAAWDLTDNAFATAKGTALTANDIFILAATSVIYLGTTSEDNVFDFSGETGQDFSVIS